MKTTFPLVFAVASLMFLMVSCDSRRTNQSGIAALGIHSIQVQSGEINSISIVREVDGARTVWLTSGMEADGLAVHIQLGLPGNTMRVAIGGGSSAAASTFEADVIKEHPFAFYSSAIRKPGEYTLMETQDRKLSNQNKILLIAE